MKAIAVDAMGGDFAPTEILKGAVRCAKSSEIRICLFGPEKQILNELDEIEPSWRNLKITLKDSPQVIEMGEEPVESVRRKKDSSLVRAVESVKNGDCSAVVSAGNSGAVMAAAVFFIGREEGIERPALISRIPGLRKPVICLDLGANVDCKPINLYQFAILGQRYAQQVFSINRPKIGLLSNGGEPGKGSALTKQAFELIENSDLNFAGNIEPHNILRCEVDVVVSDGFSGNILLKTFEATVSSFCKEAVDFKECGGALLVGVKKPVVVVHGSASEFNIDSAIKFAEGAIR